MVNMEKLLLAIELVEEYNCMGLEDVVKKFELFSNQIIPKEAINDFKFIGLNNIDFLTSNFLTSYNLKNLFEL